MSYIERQCSLFVFETRDCAARLVLRDRAGLEGRAAGTGVCTFGTGVRGRDEVRQLEDGVADDVRVDLAAGTRLHLRLCWLQRVHANLCRLPASRTTHSFGRHILMHWSQTLRIFVCSYSQSVGSRTICI